MVRVMRVESRFRGRVADLSIKGAFIHFDDPFRIVFGQRLEIEFEACGMPFRVMACVRVVRPDSGVGVEFTDISSRGQRQLQELIRELQERQEAQQRAEQLASLAPPSNTQPAN
jgi:c-di-GMP-binding flagellar brake protein YcgR